jgi:hypothetical protein
MELDLARKQPYADPERQREVIRDQWPRSCSILRGRKAVNPPRSTYCYRATAKTEGLTDAELTSIIEDI